MENAYHPELWQNVFVVMGSSSVALIGLLFIATSLHLDEIIDNPYFRGRAYNNTRYLLIIFVEAVLILFPQPMHILGAELISVNLFGLWFPFKNFHTYFTNKKNYLSGGLSIYRGLVFIVVFLLGLAGGTALINHLYWGIYPVATSCAILLVTIVLNAWSIMVGVGQTEKRTRKRTSRTA
jgi:hypothetical protein